ncbi:MAG: nucleotidyltransferase [Cyclobacteriaceae bacterium]|nr:nucleotidyltransferase [Cyclobacteriaceae bacterium]
MKPTLLILAAGMGSRYGGLKQADQVGPSGETIIDYSIYDAIEAGFGKIVMVVRQNILEEMKNLFDSRWGAKITIEYAIQEVNVPIDGIDNLPPKRKKPWGTGHAVMVAKNLINEPFAVINADDFYGSDAFKTMSAYLQNNISENENAMVGYVLKNTLSDHGFVSRGICESDSDDYLKTITERTNIERINGEVVFKHEGGQTPLDETTQVSMNYWGFMPSFFEEAETQFKEFVQNNLENEKAEFFIPLIVSKMMEEKGLKIKVLESNAQWMGVTYKEDKPVVEEKTSRLVKAGFLP